MAIRIRKSKGTVIALCAAKTKAEPDDIYLDDNAHHALATKFGLDFESEGFITNPPIDDELKDLMLAVES